MRLSLCSAVRTNMIVTPQPQPLNFASVPLETALISCPAWHDVESQLSLSFPCKALNKSRAV